MPFSPRGGEEPNHLHRKNGRIINLWIIPGGRKEEEEEEEEKEKKTVF
jgi:hypothetical protein